MKAQQVNELRKLIDTVSQGRREYTDAANVALAYREQGQRIAQRDSELFDRAAAKGGTLLNEYNALFVFIEAHKDEILTALRGKVRK